MTQEEVTAIAKDVVRDAMARLAYQISSTVTTSLDVERFAERLAQNVKENLTNDAEYYT